MFSIASVSGLGNVVVDGRGRTVYVLTKAGKKNLPCTDASGCTMYWPDLSLPDGTKSATAGQGVNASLLGTKKANGETYPTYHGWLLYEYSGDTAAGQGRGEGVKDFGGVWYAVNAKGNLVKTTASSSTGTSGGVPSSSPTSGGYGY
jgi:predicted lipoprotein with Yx(FWY)xxD motif